MYLKRLTLSGFKSFAQKTTLEFTQGITAIVGPNGSGKSNIADAIRWVMGEQSIKTLRGKKSEDVIFSGSDKKTRLGLAEVSLEMDNSDKKIPIDYSELLITRRIYRNAQSDYLINKSKSTLGEVNLLLTKANFGHRTYSVIGQGMIDNFLIASPQERKEFFEEATGVKQYQIKKNQTILKLENVWRNLTTLKIKISEMEPQLRLLTRQVKKLNKRKEIETQFNELKLNYYSSYWQEIDKKYKQQKNKINELDILKNNIYKDWKKLEEKLNKITKDNTLSKELEKLRTYEQQIIDKKISAKEKLVVLKLLFEKQIKKTDEDAKTIPAEKITLASEKLKQINLLHQKLIEDITKEKDIHLIKRQILDIDEKINSLLDFFKPYIKQPPKIQQSKTSSSEDLNKEAQIKKLEGKINHFNLQILDIQAKIKQFSHEDTNNRSSLWQIQQNYQASQQKLNDFNNQINEARISLARTETKRFDLRQEIQYEVGALENLLTEPQVVIPENKKLEMQDKINKFKNQLEIIGGFDPEIETEYENTKQRYDFLVNQIDDLTKTSYSLKKLIEQLDKIIKKQVEKSFNEINGYFKKYFKSLFNGGKAELILIKEKENKKQSMENNQENGEQENNPAINFFQEKNKNSYSSIEIHATPPGKRLKSINALSGGEKALTSIALICAIISSNPSPFVVLDEVDAALDESNSIRFAEILEKLSHKTQFIVITHNRTTIEKGKIIYGVTMTNDGVSKLLSIKLNQIEKYKSH